MVRRSVAETTQPEEPHIFFPSMTDYQSLLRRFNNEGLQYLIVGGVAVNLHGYPRFTNDIDILLALDHVNLAKMASIMEELGYQQRLPISIQELGDSHTVQTLMKEKGLIAYSFIHANEPQFNIDVLVAQSTEFEKFSAHTMKAEVWDFEVPVISIEDLIEMKKNSDREKDRQDIIALLELKGL